MVVALLGLTVGTAATYLFLSRVSDPGDIQVAHAKAGTLVRHEEPSVGLCPWRDPDQDRHRYFPDSTGVRDETLVLSNKRLEVERRLGRPGTSEESALKVYRILKNDQVIGSVVARRARGESGVIELMLAVGTDGNIVGAKLQRLREPDAVAQRLQSPTWLGAFVGKNRDSAWRLGADIPDVPPAARASAGAILDAAHILLVLLTVADAAPATGADHP